MDQKTYTPEMDNLTETSGESKIDFEKVKYDDNVIKKIVGTAALSVDGVLALGSSMKDDIAGILSENDKTKGISVKRSDDKVVKIDIKIVSEFGKNIPTIISNVVSAVSNELEKMTGLKADEIKVEVTDSITQEELEAQQKKK